MAEEPTDTGEQSFRRLYTIDVPPQNADILFSAIPSTPWPDTPIQDFQPMGAFLAQEGILYYVPSSSSSSSYASSSSSSSDSSSDSSSSYDSSSDSSYFSSDSSYDSSSSSSSDSSV
jgi:hypothetical protein